MIADTFIKQAGNGHRHFDCYCIGRFTCIIDSAGEPVSGHHATDGTGDQ